MYTERGNNILEILLWSFATGIIISIVGHGLHVPNICGLIVAAVICYNMDRIVSFFKTGKDV